MRGEPGIHLRLQSNKTGACLRCREMTEIKQNTTEQATTQARGLLYQTLTSVFTCIVCRCAVSFNSDQWFLLATEELYYAKHALSSG